MVGGRCQSELVDEMSCMCKGAMVPWPRRAGLGGRRGLCALPEEVALGEVEPDAVAEEPDHHDGAEPHLAKRRKKLGAL